MNKIESLNNDELKEVLIKKSKKELANAIIEIRKHDTKLVDVCIEKAKKNLPFYEAEPDHIFNVYNWKTCEYFGEFSVFNGTIFDCEKWSVIEIFDMLIKAVDENLYNNRFTADIDLILVNRETLQPEARVQYIIDDGKPDIFIDVVEHDIRCRFFSNLADRNDYVTPEMELLREKELAEIEEAEYKEAHTIICPSCGDTAYNESPNGAGIMESCDFHCLCGWEEEAI